MASWDSMVTPEVLKYFLYLLFTYTASSRSAIRCTTGSGGAHEQHAEFGAARQRGRVDDARLLTEDPTPYLHYLIADVPPEITTLEPSDFRLSRLRYVDPAPYSQRDFQRTYEARAFPSAMIPAGVVTSHDMFARRDHGRGAGMNEMSWTHRDAAYVLPGIDTTKPSVARMYDFWLGGKNNFAADREAADRISLVAPGSAASARANRAFLRRVVDLLARKHGIRQFIDIGSGLPTERNTHEVAQAVDPGCRVAYVDYDPVVVSHASALLADANVIAIERDVRFPGELLADEGLAGLIDFSQPVAFLLIALLHFVSDDHSPYRVVRELMAGAAAGSFLVLSHVTADDMFKEEKETAATVYAGASEPITFRTRAEVTRFFDGLDPVPPGVEDIRTWHADSSPQGSWRTAFYGGMAQKPHR